MNRAKPIFDLGINTVFHDGMETNFSRAIVEYIKKHGESGIKEIESLIVNKEVYGYLIGESLRWIGRIDHTDTYLSRLKLLHDNLQHSESIVQDGAILGIASMDSPASIPYLRLAIDRESSPLLQNDMKQVLKQLEQTKYKNRFKWITNLFRK